MRLTEKLLDKLRKWLCTQCIYKIHGSLNTKNNPAETKVEKQTKKQALITVQQKTWNRFKHSLMETSLICLEETRKYPERYERMSWMEGQAMFLDVMFKHNRYSSFGELDRIMSNEVGTNPVWLFKHTVEPHWFKQALEYLYKSLAPVQHP